MASLDVHDGYALAVIANLGSSPTDEYDAYRIVGALVDKIMDDPERMEPTARIMIDAWRGGDDGS